LQEKLRNDKRPEEENIEDIYKNYYQDELMMYMPENILHAVTLIRRSKN